MLFVEGESKGPGTESVLVWGLASFLCCCMKQRLWKGTRLLSSSFIGLL